MNQIKAQNSEIKAKLASKSLTEIDLIKHDESLSRAIAKLSTISSIDEAKLRIECEELRCLNSLFNTADRASNQKWLESGLHLLNLYSFLHENSYTDLASSVLVESAVLVLVSPVFEMKKAKLLNILNSLKQKHFVFDIISDMESLRIIQHATSCKLSLAVAKECQSSFLQLVPGIEHNLEQSLFEYNVFAVSSIYSSISYENLFQNCLELHKFPQFDNKIATKKLMAMVKSGRLHAKLNQVNETIIFDAKPEIPSANHVIQDWRTWYMNEFLTSVNNASVMITSANTK